MKTLLEVINLSSDYLEKQGVKNSRREALDLIGLGLKLRPLDLYVQYDRPLNESELEACRNLLKRRIKGEPIQYIRGEVDFYNCTFEVTPNVLIPRNETEILVDRIAALLAGEQLVDKTLVDLCCGSGCIGISLKKRFPQLHVILSDLSPSALEIAKKNAIRNEVSVNFVCGDFLAPLQGQHIDYLICNPPYVSEEEFDTLEIEVRQYEPKLALVGQENGLEFYKKLESEFLSLMNPNGKVWLEIGAKQGMDIAKIFEKCPAKSMQIQQDWAGHDRFFFLELE